MLLLHELLKKDTIHWTTFQGPFDEHFELPYIASEQFGSFVIEWIVRIRFVEQVDETVNDTVNVQYWFPIFSQYIQTNFSFQINVGMINACPTFDFRWGVWIVRWNGKREMIGSMFPIS